MKLDPRDRPTAKELLQDEWLNSDKKRRFTNAATRAPNQRHTSLLQVSRDVPIAYWWENC